MSERRLYTVTKEAGRPQDPDLTAYLCGRACVVSVLSEEALKELKEKTHILVSDLWERQDVLKPKIGSPILFESVKMDCGYLRTSPVVSFEEDNGDFVIGTLNSTYYVKVEKDAD